MKARIASVWGICLIFTFLVMLATGCQSGAPLEDNFIGAGYKPANITGKTNLPPQVRRVLVLPITSEEGSAWAESGRESLTTGVKAEMNKVARFETYFPSRQQLTQWTGKPAWRADDELPASFFDNLREKSGCDAVFFVHLSQYNPYPPLMVGWRMKLIQVAGRETLWAADEVFDASSEAVSNGARRFAKHNHPQTPALEDSRAILLLPSRFGQYAMATLLQTLPAR